MLLNLWPGRIQLHRDRGGEGVWRVAAASRVGRSFAPIPSCMPCMSFLVFEAFFKLEKKKKQIKNRDT